MQCGILTRLSTSRRVSDAAVHGEPPSCISVLMSTLLIKFFWLISTINGGFVRSQALVSHRITNHVVLWLLHGVANHGKPRLLQHLTKLREIQPLFVVTATILALTTVMTADQFLGKKIEIFLVRTLGKPTKQCHMLSLTRVSVS
jgi:uncharacterized membrane protein YGL010W